MFQPFKRLVAPFLPGGLAASVVATLREHWRPLVACHLFFTLLAASLLLPITAGALAALLKRLGRPVFTNAQLLEMALSPSGLAWLLAAIVLAVLIILLQQAGLILVAMRPGASRYRAALEALWSVLRRFPAVTGLALLKVSTHLALAFPLLLVLVGLYRLLLDGLESYYVLRVQPREWWLFVAAALLPVALWLWFAARLYLRWSLALAVMILEDTTPWQALGRSHRLTRGVKRRLAVPVAVPILLIVALPALITGIFDQLSAPLLGWLPGHGTLLIPAMLVYLTLYGLLALAGTFVGVAVNALVAACLYLRLAHARPRPSAPPPNAHPGLVAWGVEIAVLLFAVSQALSVLNSFEIRDRVIITAHRGSSAEAPENTLAAIERAIADGADYVEFDVRLTADDRVIVSHDDNLRRLTGVDRRLSDMPLEEVRQVDVGSWFGDAYTDQRIPALGDVLALTRNRIGLYIELKPRPGNEGKLAAAVIDALPAARHDTTILASLSSRAIREARRLAPTLRTTLFAQFVVRGGMDLSLIDALGLRHNRVTGADIEIARRHGYELHTWTVNRRAEMSRLIDLGVDNIITDRPALLAEVLSERAALSDGELLLVKLRNWLHS